MVVVDVGLLELPRADGAEPGLPHEERVVLGAFDAVAALERVPLAPLAVPFGVGRATWTGEPLGTASTPCG